MTSPIEELKIRARLLRKALTDPGQAAHGRAVAIAKQRRWAIPDAWTLSLCLNVVSVEAGFNTWDHARKVLGGEARPTDDMGTFWYDKTCSALLNHWFARYEDACETLQKHSGRYLLPYGRQFIVADAPFIVAIGLDPASSAWTAIGHDLVGGYGGSDWQKLVEERLRYTKGHP
ncbi:hypothetical protein [Noviherbaspirillum autotrophicum]|uniref:hypothetical protein n=1 Tax=Noviherbaspirillum autotrophicum TaxID=709839 RepID=UPI000693EE7D|nr:hypothetical protein [Noviherbaspirillum autotrophicum]